MSEKQPFERLDIRVGKVLSVEYHPDADSLLIEKIDVGESEPRTIISGLRKYITNEEFIGKNVLVLCNLKPRKMRGIISHGMVLCASDKDHSVVELLEPTSDTVNAGSKVTVEGFDSSAPDNRLNPKKKWWQKCEIDFKSNENGLACYQSKILTTEDATVFSPKTLKTFTVG